MRNLKRDLKRKKDYQNNPKKSKSKVFTMSKKPRKVKERRNKNLPI